MSKLESLLAARTEIAKLKDDPTCGPMLAVLDSAIAAERQSGEGREEVTVEKIRAKQAAKPTGSALPVHTATDPVAGVSEDEVAILSENMWAGPDATITSWANLREFAKHQLDGLMSDEMDMKERQAIRALAALRARPNEGTFAEGVDAMRKSAIWECECAMPTTQDMASTQLCDALTRVCDKIRTAEPKQVQK